MGDKSDNVSLNGKSNSENPNETEYLLTPIQMILINKKMPKGFKLESEENIVKALELFRPSTKKQKISHKELTSVKEAEDSKRKRNKKIDFSDVLSKDNSEFSGKNKKRSLREKKPIVHEDLGYVEKDKLKGPKNPILADIAKKCEKGFLKIKKNPLADFFMNPASPDAPSLSQIEKNLKNYAYTSVYQFGLDLRKLWTHHFSTYTGNGEIFQKTCKMSEFSEEILKELDSTQEEKSDIQELSKKVEKLTKEVKEISHKGGQPTPGIASKKGDKNVYTCDKPMSMQEKNSLGNAIRNLTPDQLKGIVNILSDSLVIDPQSRYFEFDIETLSPKKLRELEKYVKDCQRTPNKAQPNKNQDTKTTKKPTSIQSTGEMSENERVAKLKNDLAINKVINQEQLSTINSQTQQANRRPISKKNIDEKELKNISDSDDSLSSSEESDSESLSSLDFKKQTVGK